MFSTERNTVFYPDTKANFILSQNFQESILKERDAFLSLNVGNLSSESSYPITSITY